MKHLETEGVLIREQADRYHWRSTPNNGDTHSYKLRGDVLGFATQARAGEAVAGEKPKRGDPEERLG